jgi:hypothetical protein
LALGGSQRGEQIGKEEAKKDAAEHGEGESAYTESGKTEKRKVSLPELRCSQLAGITGGNGESEAGSALHAKYQFPSIN